MKPVKKTLFSKLMKKTGLNRKDISDVLGIHENSIRKLESGERKATKQHIYSLILLITIISTGKYSRLIDIIEESGVKNYKSH